MSSLLASPCRFGARRRHERPGRRASPSGSKRSLTLDTEWRDPSRTVCKGPVAPARARATHHVDGLTPAAYTGGTPRNRRLTGGLRVLTEAGQKTPVFHPGTNGLPALQARLRYGPTR